MRLYLDNTATGSPFPTTSKQLVTSAPASEVQLGPGEFDNGLPGVADAGQWNPSSPLADTTLAAEIDNPGASLGTTRQGWLYNVALTGKRLPPGTYNVQLRIRANQGTGTLARMFARVTIVQGSAGTWVTQANLLTTAVTGGAPTAGQAGWRAQQDVSRITVTSTAANFTGAIADAAASAGYTFGANDRILVELGFGDADSNTDRTWRLDYNQGSSFIDIPDLVDPIDATFAGSSSFSAAIRGIGRLSATLGGSSTFAASLSGKGQMAAAFAGSSAFNATLSAKLAMSATFAGSSSYSGALVGKGVIAAVLSGSSTFSGSLVDAGGASSIAGTFAGSSSFSGTLVDATPPTPPTPPRRRRTSGGGGGGGYVYRYYYPEDATREVFELEDEDESDLPFLLVLAATGAVIVIVKTKKKRRGKWRKKK